MCKSCSLAPKGYSVITVSYNVSFRIPSGLNLVESYPYEAMERDYDYVRLASITAGK